MFNLEVIFYLAMLGREESVLLVEKLLREGYCEEKKIKSPLQVMKATLQICRGSSSSHMK